MLFEVNKEVRDLLVLAQGKDIIIFRLLEDNIRKLYLIGFSIKNIKRLIEDEFKIKINYNNLKYFISRYIKK